LTFLTVLLIIHYFNFFYFHSIKVDRLYGWKKCPNAPIVKALKQQNEDVKREFNMRLTDVSEHHIVVSFFLRRKTIMHCHG